MAENHESRRSFLKTSFAASVAAAAASFVPVEALTTVLDKPNRTQAYKFFNPDEADFIEAAVERLIPADDDWPGAVDAGVVDFIDQQMAGKWGNAGYFYWKGPWKPGTPSQGYQLAYTPAELFHRAISAINQNFGQRGTRFSRLSQEEQDDYLRMLQNDSADLNGVPSKVFFDFLLQHTVEGFFCDPVYGGNRNMVSWRMIGFPGPYADYYELIGKHGVKLVREPVSLSHGRLNDHHAMTAAAPASTKE
jgi:gluconate 2-dehydrogenase gamma chain